MSAILASVSSSRQQRTDVTLLVVAALLALFGASASAETLPETLAVIVNPASGVERMTRSEVAAVFMARDRKLASGVTALPLDIAGDAQERKNFYRTLVGKTVPEVNAYWARLLFTGRATPPQQLDDAASIVAAVAENKGAIGYIEKSKVDSRVRVVLELSP